jgi:hypothetical protein
LISAVLDAADAAKSKSRLDRPNIASLSSAEKHREKSCLRNQMQFISFRYMRKQPG